MLICWAMFMTLRAVMNVSGSVSQKKRTRHAKKASVP